MTQKMDMKRYVNDRQKSIKWMSKGELFYEHKKWTSEGVSSYLADNSIC